MEPGPDPRRLAGDEVLDRLVPGTTAASTTVIRDGAALLLRRGPALVRARPVAGSSVAEREVRLATTLSSLAIPVTPLLDPDGQPWSVGSAVVTAWRWSAGGPAVTPEALGRLARTLRELGSTAATRVPVLDPIEAALGAVAHLPADDDEAAFVRAHAAGLAEAWASAAGEDPLGRSIVHGDLHAANVVAGPDGPLLTDLELAGSGPPSYDAAPAAVAVGRYGTDPATLDAFLAGFGHDPRTWAGFATLVSAYELWVTAWAVGVRHQDPAWAAEASRRVATLRDGADHTWILS